MNVTARLLYAALWLAGRLPLRLAQALGAGIGTLVRLVGLREARVSRRNLELCFPALDAQAREALLRDSLRETGRTLMETARCWTRPTPDNLRLVRAVEGAELFDAALASGRGVIVAAPHLGNWELLNQWLAQRTPIAIVYRPPRSAWMEALLRTARGHPGVSQVRAEAAGVRQLFRVLKDGGCVGILPDQQPKRGDGEFAPFFGVQALTMTLLSRLANKAGAVVLFAWAQRRDDGGFDVRFRDAPAGIDAADAVVGVTALNAGVETCAREAPSQYQWSYKRFTMRPPAADGAAAEPNPY